MKKALILTILVMGLSATAFAGPLIGIQVAPAINSTAALTVGWDFGSAVIEGSKTNFNTWYGEWTIAGLWTPADQTFSYRLGPKLIWDWYGARTKVGSTWYEAGQLVYRDLAIVIGVSTTWGPLQVFGEFDIGSTGTLGVKPLIGFNIVFAGFFVPSVDKGLNLE